MSMLVESKEKLAKKLDDTPIEDLDLSARSYVCLIRAGIKTVGELFNKSPKEISEIKNLPPRCYEEILSKLNSWSLSIKEEVKVMEKSGVIYILTNPSFPEYVKIGYADNIDKRLKDLNRSECIPFAFRVYATYEVNSRLSDLKIHTIIDKLNPNLRSIDNFNGQKRVREFYAMSPEDAYSILEAIAEIHGCTDRLIRIKQSDAELEDEETAQEIIAERREKAAPFRFSMAGIPVGAELEFWRTARDNSGIFCVVLDDKHVGYNGKAWSLSSLVSELSDIVSAQGPKYFKYKGEWLNDLRERNGF